MTECNSGSLHVDIEDKNEIFVRKLFKFCSSISIHNHYGPNEYESTLPWSINLVCYNIFVRSSLLFGLLFIIFNKLFLFVLYTSTICPKEIRNSNNRWNSGDLSPAMCGIVWKEQESDSEWKININNIIEKIDTIGSRP